jgi:ribosome maturation protein Sdo1
LAAKAAIDKTSKIEHPATAVDDAIGDALIRTKTMQNLK